MVICHRDNYGFVTYYNTRDAFTAIENGSKLRKPDELPFDLCFGGRRQFCQSNYADLGMLLNFQMQKKFLHNSLIFLFLFLFLMQFRLYNHFRFE